VFNGITTGTSLSQNVTIDGNNVLRSGLDGVDVVTRAKSFAGVTQHVAVTDNTVTSAGGFGAGGIGTGADPGGRTVNRAVFSVLFPVSSRASNVMRFAPTGKVAGNSCTVTIGWGSTTSSARAAARKATTAGFVFAIPAAVVATTLRSAGR